MSTVATLTGSRLVRLRQRTGRVVTGASVGLLAFTIARVWLGHEPQFGDVYAYWQAWDGGLYDNTRIGGPHAYLYSPAFAQLLWPLTLLPFAAFYGLLLAVDVAALIWLVGWRWAGWAAVLFYPVTLEMSVGNIHLPLAAAIVISLRHPWMWPLPLLTKVTPGIGIIWYAVRGEWRSCVLAVVTAGAVVLLSVLVSLTAGHPEAWIEWVNILMQNAHAGDDWAFIQFPLWMRLPIAAVMVAVAAARSWGWLLPIAILVSLPIIWVGSLAMLLAAWKAHALASGSWANRGNAVRHVTA